MPCAIISTGIHTTYMHDICMHMSQHCNFTLVISHTHLLFLIRSTVTGLMNMFSILSRKTYENVDEI